MGKSWRKVPRDIPTILNAAFNDTHAQDDELSERPIRAGIDLDTFPTEALEKVLAKIDPLAALSAMFGAGTLITLLSIAGPL